MGVIVMLCENANTRTLSIITYDTVHVFEIYYSSFNRICPLVGTPVETVLSPAKVVVVLHTKLSAISNQQFEYLIDTTVMDLQY
jgi:hypothetical protein